jgi:hypothetical protein
MAPLWGSFSPVCSSQQVVQKDKQDKHLSQPPTSMPIGEVVQKDKKVRTRFQENGI